MTILSSRSTLEDGPRTAAAEGAAPGVAAAAGLQPATYLAGVRPLPGDPYRASSVPIYQTATFAQETADGDGPYDYTRSGNPMREALEGVLARLDGAAAALAYASGVAVRFADAAELLARHPAVARVHFPASRTIPARRSTRASRRGRARS
jgi:cystathionine beta-lyase/cystathionine gamma-synthase